VWANLFGTRSPISFEPPGRTPHATMLAADPYRAALSEKLREEVDELIAATATHALIEEAADVLEVLTAIAPEHGVSLTRIFDVAQRKRAETGGFDMRLWLVGAGRRRGTERNE
jgi:predicted house-cleaning noncanonical NTP pyrophosphatase (MazG superfamily)